MLQELAENTLNRWIGESTPARRALASLEGKSLAITIEGPDLRLLLVAGPGRIGLQMDGESPASVELRGSPIDLARLAGRSSLADVKRTGVGIAGELQVAEDFAEMLRLARPDIEEELAGWIGDIPAHWLGRRFAGARRFGERSGRALEMNVSEYLREEVRALPDDTQVQAFAREVERLRDDVERCAARLHKVESAIGR